MPKALAAAIAFPLSFCISGLIPSIREIPVYRGSKAILKTFRQSVQALSEGENLLICPDIDYTDTSSSMGEMYHGFLNLEKYYFKKTGSHLAFVPVHISKRRHCIYMGEAICFKTENDFKQEKIKVYGPFKRRVFTFGKTNRSSRAAAGP